MFTYTAGQSAALATKDYEITWLFDVGNGDSLFDELRTLILDETGSPITDNSGVTTHRWSTKSYTHYLDSDDTAWQYTQTELNQGYITYTARIVSTSFNGITIGTSSSANGIVAPTDVSFTVTNKDNEYSIDDFRTGTEWSRITLRLLINGVEILAWTLRIKDVVDLNQRLHFTCEDYLQKNLEGTWPNTPLVSSLSDSLTGDPDDSLCVPVPFGTVYIPLRSVYIASRGSRYYVLGPADNVTYTIYEVRSPREFGGESIWTSDDYTFQQSTETINGVNYRVFQPLIADGAAGFWKSGSDFLSPLVKFSRSDLATKTNFADVIAYLLQQWNVPLSLIDQGTGSTFETASSDYSDSSIGLEFEYGFYYAQSRQAILASILTACNSILRITDKIELHFLSRDSRKTLTTSDIQKTGMNGTSTFNAGLVKSETLTDAAYTAFSATAEPMDQLFKVVCTPDGSDTYSNIEDNCFQNPYVHDSQLAKRAGELWAQQLYWPDREYSFICARTHLNLHPSDVITIGNARYGGTYRVLIERLSIDRAGRPRFDVSGLKYNLENWSDNTPLSITLVDDTTTGACQPVLSNGGSSVSSGIVPNKLQGKLIIGTGLELDGTSSLIKAFSGTNYVYIAPGGITGYDSVLGTTFKLLTDGSAPEFSSGVIKECEYQIYTSGVIRTNADPASDGGLLINNTELKGYSTYGSETTLFLKFVYDGANAGDAYIGDFDNGNSGIKYDHSAGTFSYRGDVYILSGGNVDLAGGGDLILRAITGSSVANRAIIKFPVGDAEEIWIAGDYDNRRLSIAPKDYYSSYATDFRIGYDAYDTSPGIPAEKPFYNIDLLSYSRTTIQSKKSVSDAAFMYIDCDYFSESIVSFAVSHDGTPTQTFSLIATDSEVSALFIGGQVKITNNAGVNVAAFYIDQDDIDEPFIEYDGVSEAGTTKNITTYTSGAVLQGFARISINGTDRWMPFYSAPTS